MRTLCNILGVTEALCSKQNKDISRIYLNLFRILNDETRKTRMFTSDLSNKSFKNTWKKVAANITSKNKAFGKSI